MENYFRHPISDIKLCGEMVKRGKWQFAEDSIVKECDEVIKASDLRFKDGE